jgi:2,6-dihydroxypyridine 3-monooxygenase
VSRCDRLAGPRTSAIVVGGSLGGLNAANWLRDAGLSVTVFERSSGELKDRGVGIVLHPATGRFLFERCGLGVDDLAIRTNYLRYLDADEGVVHESQSAVAFTSYGDLLGSFAAAFGSDAYRTGSSVCSFDLHATRPSVTLTDETVHDADIVVFADGIASTARAALSPAATPAWAGYVAWRGVVDVDALGCSTRSTLGAAITYSLVAGGHLLTYPIADRTRDRLLLNWLWYRNVPSESARNALLRDTAGVQHERSVPSGLVPGELLDEMRTSAKALFHPWVVEMVESTAEPFLQAVFDLETPRLMYGAGFLIGDAAFVARPHAAAGTAKACEDGRQLAQALVSGGGGALAAWESGALKRGRGLVSRSRSAGQRLQTHGAWSIGEPLPFGLYSPGDGRF